MKDYIAYLETEEERRQRIQADCTHPHWVTTCSHCRAILNDEKLEEHESAEEILI